MLTARSSNNWILVENRRTATKFDATVRQRVCELLSRIYQTKKSYIPFINNNHNSTSNSNNNNNNNNNNDNDDINNSNNKLISHAFNMKNTYKVNNSVSVTSI